ncbi:MAG: UbiA-like protein EboC [Rhodothermales bacterium]|nr:UbiA-like protein EboC [Rhodothermales bacterium]
MRSYLQLARPANIVTAWADVLAGFAVTGGLAAVHIQAETLGWLLLSTTGLYAGGVAFNDVFDANLDAVERPERPIPAGRVTRQNAAIFAGSLLLGGIAAAFAASPAAGLLALAIAAAALVYDAYGKHHALLGPINMGLCRGGNLLLGMGAAPLMIVHHWPLALLPIVYIAAITAISRGEVTGGSKRVGYLAVGLVVLVILALGYIGFDAVAVEPVSGLFPFIFTGLVLPAFLRAAKQPTAETIQRAVRTGIMGLIVLNAAIAALYAGPTAGLAILSLLPVSVLLARLFAVT